MFCFKTLINGKIPVINADGDNHQCASLISYMLQNVKIPSESLSGHFFSVGFG
ncbi:MAG: hypothetical protein IKV88_02350 [Clostridia bacterium]|nr:hypothetical protein [Clostridia bacterium]